MNSKYIIAAMIAVSLLAITATATTYDDFESGTYLLVPDGTMSPNGLWLNIWNGFGSSGVENIDGNGMMFLQPAKAKGGSTRSTLVKSTQTFSGSYEISYDARTFRQLKDRPRAWEVDWLMVAFKDVENYYYFIHKLNGIELGKKQGSLTQIFLYTANSPQKTIGTWYNYKINVTEISPTTRNIRVWIDGNLEVNYTDTNSTLTFGAIAPYTEDARVNFDNVSVAVQ